MRLLQEGFNAMERSSSPSESLRTVLKSTLFLLGHYEKYIDHRDAGSELNGLTLSLKRAIAVLENAPDQCPPNYLDRFPADHISGV